MATQAINLVRQKALAGLGFAEPYTHLALKAFFRYMSEHQGNPDLEYVAFGDLTSDTVIDGAAGKLYVVYAKKQGTATDAFLKWVDHATVAAGTTFSGCVELNVANEFAFIIYPEGLAHSVGLTIVSSTTDVGGTDSTSGDGPDGFFIIGDA